ncbi:MAG: hypothetical protein WC082_11295 [Victivallales bacterium]
MRLGGKQSRRGIGMAKAVELKRTQVQGKIYDLPEEEVTLEKLIKRGLVLENKISGLTKQLEELKGQIIAIADKRREGATTVNLKGVSGSSIVTYRESLVCDDRVEEIRQELGSLFDRFFKKAEEFKAQKELKLFLSGANAYGLDDPESLKKLILNHVKQKATKPNVKLTAP